jgi:hypothetical protein
MRRQTVVALCCALALSACTSIRVQGFVTDEKTGEPVGTAGVTLGERYTHVDTAGHYVLNVRKYWKNMQVVAPGYEIRTMKVDLSGHRAPQINVQMTPKPMPKVHVMEAPPKGDASKAVPTKPAPMKAAESPPKPDEAN